MDEADIPAFQERESLRLKAKKHKYRVKVQILYDSHYCIQLNMIQNSVIFSFKREIHLLAYFSTCRFLFKLIQQ